MNGDLKTIKTHFSSAFPKLEFGVPDRDPSLTQKGHVKLSYITKSVEFALSKNLVIQVNWPEDTTVIFSQIEHFNFLSIATFIFTILRL